MRSTKIVLLLIPFLIVSALPFDTLIVEAQSIQWNIYPQKWTILQGNSVTYYVVVISHSKVSLDIKGLPQDASAKFDPPSGSSLTGTFTSKLTISTKTTTPLGIYSLTVIVTERTQTQKTMTLKLVPNTPDGASLVLCDAYAKYLSPMFWVENAVVALALFSSDFGCSFTNPFSILREVALGIAAPALSDAEILMKQILTLMKFLSASGMGAILGSTNPGISMVNWEIHPLVEISSLIERGDRAGASNRIIDFLSKLHNWLINVENYKPDNLVVTEQIKQAARNLILSCINFLQSELIRLGAPTLRVISPNGNEIWGGGSAQTIRWVSVGVTGNVRVDISRDGGSTWATIIPSTPNDGSESWTVTGPTTTRARIRVVSLVNPTIWDMSDQAFTIDAVSPSVRVISPNGGEVWKVSSIGNLWRTQTIRWSASDNIGVTRIDIFYSTDGGKTWRTIATGLTNTGSYTWRVPDTPSKNCLVRVDAYDAAGNRGSDTSDKPFTIER